MGFEYRLDFGRLDAKKADQILRSVAGFERFDPEYGTYSYRRKSTGEMPDLDAKVEPTGVYLCDHGPGADVLEEIRCAFAEAGLRAIPFEI